MLRDAFIGAALVLFGGYVAAAAVWTWLAWPGQRFDPIRIIATSGGLLTMLVGARLIRMWRDGEWFELPERGRSSGGGGSPGSSDGGFGDCGSDGGSGDGGSCGS